MLRHSLIYLLLSVLVVVFAKYAHLLIVSIDACFNYINHQLTPVFSASGWGVTIRKTLVLMGIPLLLTAIPALCYRVVKGNDMPHFIAVSWVIWTVVVLSNILI